MAIVCYCKNISEEDIIDHVAYKKCCSNIEDIQKHTGANTGNQCHMSAQFHGSQVFQPPAKFAERCAGCAYNDYFTHFYFLHSYAY